MPLPNYQEERDVMAIDVYLQIDGIKGESKDSGHQGWIELASASWGVAQPRSATASTAGGHAAERCEHRTLLLSKLADLASPLLLQHCSMGKTIPKARLEFMRADGDGKPVKYYQIDLENVMIASVEQMVSQGNILHDSIGLRFSKVKLYLRQALRAACQGGISIPPSSHDVLHFARGPGVAGRRHAPDRYRRHQSSGRKEDAGSCRSQDWPRRGRPPVA
jgi:type VI secretion system secreted protein Hcp